MVDSNDPFLTCHRGIAHPWLCDQLNHFNTRHYMAAYDDAMQHLFSMLGYRMEEGFGWADVKHEITYSAEIPPGALFHIDAAIIRIGTKSINYLQKLILTDTGEVASTNTATTVLFNTSARKAVPVPDIISANAVDHTVEIEES